MNTWEEIRAMWVNGERAEVFEALDSASKEEILSTLKRGLIASYNGLSHGTHSGDLVDMIEIIIHFENMEGLQCKA